jgi:DNA-binding CsgD family transcriptional regulator
LIPVNFYNRQFLALFSSRVHRIPQILKHMLAYEFRYYGSEARPASLSQPIIQSALRIQTIDNLSQWMKTEVNAVVPHRAALLLLGRPNSSGVHIFRKLALNMPSAFMQAIEDEYGQIHCPYLARWHATGESQVITGSKVDFMTYSRWKTAFFANELQPGLLDVSIDNPSKTRLFLYLFGLRVPAAEAIKLAPALITSFAHDAWLKALKSSSVEVAAVSEDCKSAQHILHIENAAPAIGELSQAEQQIANQLRLGKPTKEIAKKLGKSHHTISKQLQSIFRKTGCTTRTELAVKLNRVESSIDVES